MKRVNALRWVLYVLVTGTISIISFMLGQNSVVATVDEYGNISKSMVTMTHGTPYHDVRSIIDVNNAISDLCHQWVASGRERWVEAYVVPTGGNSYTVLYWAGALGKAFPDDLKNEIDRIIEGHQFMK